MPLNQEQTLTALDCCSNSPRPDCNNCPMGEKRGCVIDLITITSKHYRELMQNKEKLNEVD